MLRVVQVFAFGADYRGYGSAPDAVELNTRCVGNGGNMRKLP
jgi:hypothetical protein